MTNEHPTSFLNRLTSYIAPRVDEEQEQSETKMNGYTYYQQKQEQLKRQQDNQNKKRKYFSQSSHAPPPKPGTITKVRGAQYTLPVNPHTSTTTTTTTADHTTNKDKHVSLEVAQRVIEVDEMKLQQQIQTIQYTTSPASIGTPTTPPNDQYHTSHLSKTVDSLLKIGNVITGTSKHHHHVSTPATPPSIEAYKYISTESDTTNPMDLNTGGASSRNSHISDLEEKRDHFDDIINQNKLEKFYKLLNKPDVDLDALRKLSWNGIPTPVRALTWKLLLGYANCNAGRREQLLQKKRLEYIQMVEKFFNEGTMKKTEYENSLQKQIYIDVLRTNPDVKLFQQQKVQAALERILYIWSVRHPASGYVQGINDLVTPFMIVFLRDELANTSVNAGNVPNILSMDVDAIDDDALQNMESDSFWCFTQFLDFIQDHYTFAQPGLQRMVHKLEEITRKVDEPLYNHIQQQGLDFIQFAFRWMNCLLMREMSLKLIIRIFDSYLAEGDNFEILHVYVCATFLKTWSERLRSLDFTEMVIFIQHLPTQSWTYKEIETLLGQAYMLKVRYENSNHLTQP